MESHTYNLGFYQRGGTASVERNGDHLRLTQFDLATEKLDWQIRQNKWFGQSTAIAYGNWGNNDIFLGGAFGNKKAMITDSTVELAPFVF